MPCGGVGTINRPVTAITGCGCVRQTNTNRTELMKRLIPILLAAVSTALPLAAQQPQRTAAPVSHDEWLSSFTRVRVEGPIDVTFVAAAEAEAPRITCDSCSAKFRAEVRNGVLCIRERSDVRRPERTKVEVRYNEIAELEAIDARILFADTLRRQLWDVTLGGQARMEAAVAVDDLQMELTGRAEATLAGSARYLTLFASGATAALTELETVSARVNAQGKASVRLFVTDRLESRTSTGGSIRYKGAPPIIRSARKFMAGEIESVER